MTVTVEAPPVLRRWPGRRPVRDSAQDLCMAFMLEHAHQTEPNCRDNSTGIRNRATASPRKEGFAPFIQLAVVLSELFA